LFPLFLSFLIFILTFSATAFQKFLKILKKLFSKSFLSGSRAEPLRIPLRQRKSNLKIGNEVTNFWGGFSAKKKNHPKN